jgi:hypothetical protein
MDAYDLDDTLADASYISSGFRGLVNVFKTAKVIYKPSSPFIVITARTHSTAAERAATLEWLRTNQPNFKAIYYVSSGGAAKVAEEKLRVMKEHNVTSFTDNNSDILAELKKLDEGIELYKMSAGKRTKY